MLSQEYYVIIYCGVSVLVNGKEADYILSATDKKFLFQLIETVKIPGLNVFDTQMVMHFATINADFSLAK